MTVQDKYQSFQKDQRAFFDKLITEDWESYHCSYWDQQRTFEIDSIFQYLESGIQRVLDVGCGCGFHDKLIADIPGIEKVIGIDYSEKSIEKANEFYPHPKVERSVADLSTYRAPHFDLIVSFQVIEHVEDPVDFLSQCCRLTRQGGWIAISTPNRHALENRLRNLIGFDSKFVDPMHFKEYSHKEMIQMGNQINLKCIYQVSYGCSLSYGNRQIRFPEFIGKRIPSISSSFLTVFRTPID